MVKAFSDESERIEAKVEGGRLAKALEDHHEYRIVKECPLCSSEYIRFSGIDKERSAVCLDCGGCGPSLDGSSNADLLRAWRSAEYAASKLLPNVLSEIGAIFGVAAIQVKRSTVVAARAAVIAEQFHGIKRLLDAAEASVTTGTPHEIFRLIDLTPSKKVSQ